MNVRVHARAQLAQKLACHVPSKHVVRTAAQLGVDRAHDEAHALELADEQRRAKLELSPGDVEGVARLRAREEELKKAAPEKARYTFEVFYNLWMGRVVSACNKTGCFDVLDQFEAGAYK